MDNNLSYGINVKKVMEILNEDTDSGVPRLDRIRLNNINLFTSLNFPSEVTEDVAENLINWNDAVFLRNSKTIYMAESELKKYMALIDLMIDALGNLDLVLPSVKEFKYKDINKLLSNISENSKIISRINNLKIMCAMYGKKKLEAAIKDRLYGDIVKELYHQKAFFYNLNQKFEHFGLEKLPLAILLYDIPGTPETIPYYIKKI